MPPADGPKDDGPPPGQARLIIAWATVPTIPGNTPEGNHYDDVKFRMENFKATVDEDPNNPNASKSEYQLHWDDDDTPTAITFDNAPIGTYRSIVLQLDEGDGEEAFEFRGTTAGGNTFKIDDNSSLSINMECNFTLEPDTEKTVTIEIDLGPALDAVDFSQIDSGDGFDEHLDADAPEAMATFRAALQEAFSVRESDGG